MILEDLVTLIPLILAICLVCIVEVTSHLFLYHQFVVNTFYATQSAGVRQDGRISYFFHRRFESYNNEGDKNISWKKIGTSRPIILDGTLQGCKEVFVLYEDTMSDRSPQETDWRLHQYHIRNTVKDDVEVVVSKIFFESRNNPSELAEGAPIEAKQVTTFFSRPLL